MASAARCSDIFFARGQLQVLNGLSLEINPGEVVGIRGPSGSGKSTLLHLLAGLMVPDSGEIWLGSTRIDTLSDRKRSRTRLTKVGIVFQGGDLVPELTLGENVALPMRLLGTQRKEAHARAHIEMENLGISDLFDRSLGEVSGGQAQRAALARALVIRPSLLLADEPTGALDDENAAHAIETLVLLAKGQGIAAAVVTHSSSVASACDRIVRLESGTLTHEKQA